MGALALATAAFAAAVVVTRPGTPAGIASADLPRLLPDGEIEAAELAHDSRDDLYRVPVGAVPTASGEVALRFRAGAGDLTEATVRVYDALREIQALIPMEVVATDATAGEHG